MAADSTVMPLSQIDGWLAEQSARLALSKRRIAFAELDQWVFRPDPLRLGHSSGNFFEIEGMRVETDFDQTRSWDQPIIRQPEVGILGAVARSFNGVLHLLLQAKIEPGNINGIQLSPTEQATRSNYRKVHGGNLPPFHKYFTEAGHGHVLVDRLLSEHGDRFLRKRNRNVIVEVGDDVEAPDGFCWLTIGQIHRLMQRDNLINMTTRSVISCILPPPGEAASYRALDRASGFGIPLADSLRGERSLHATDGLLCWLSDLRARHHIRTYRRGIDALDGWQFQDDEIRWTGAAPGHAEAAGRGARPPGPADDPGFSVIAVSVEAHGREVRRWTQPLVHHPGIGVNGFLTRRIEGVLHFLVRAWLPPGGDTSLELGSSVSCASQAALAADVARHPELAPLLNPAAATIRHRSIQSEEGGRFDQYRSLYLIVESPEATGPVQEPDGMRWMTLGQIAAFTHFGMVNIEARNLLACLSFCADEPVSPRISNNVEMA
ncbi:NDP-hexose 2,3-dehydratase family protein [Poseidonocella sedimentorum]|nr:NDP-hexose 2,3-dehydratase family protein [Poseidonocella sedimentorum]